MSMTEKVRIKSITESARIIIVDIQSKEDLEAEEEEEEDITDDDDDQMELDEYMDAPGRWEMESARVYEKTIQLLGDELGKQDVP